MGGGEPQGLKLTKRTKDNQESWEQEKESSSSRNSPIGQPQEHRHK